MPTATLRFTLPEERDEFDDAIDGTDSKVKLERFADALRQKIKYGDVQATTWEEVRDLFQEVTL